jgi:lipopolysaccharide export system permease protein
VPTVIEPAISKTRYSGGRLGVGHWWSSSKRLWIYILKALLGPFTMSLVVIMFVFVLQFLMRFIDRIVGRGLGLWTIIELIALNLAWMVVLAVPMSVLVACVMAFGSLSASNEMTAMKASGVSFARMMFPVILFGIVIGYGDLVFNNDVLPDANHAAKDLMSDIQRKKPTFSIEPGQFSDDDAIPGYSILARKSLPSTSELEDLTIYNHSEPNKVTLMTAKRAKVSFTSDFRSIIMTMHDGEVHEYSSLEPATYRRGTFHEYVVHIPTNGFDFMRQGESERSDRELSAADLLKFVHARDTIRMRLTKSLTEHLISFAKDIASPNAPLPGLNALSGVPNDAKSQVRAQFQIKYSQIQNDIGLVNNAQQDMDSYMVEVHKKYAIPVACIVFVLIGAPLGALAKRSGIGVGVGMSIGFFVMYWIFLIGGEKLADRGKITPFMGMWGGNILLIVLGIYLTWRVASESPGLNLKALFRRPKKIQTST